MSCATLNDYCFCTIWSSNERSEMARFHQTLRKQRSACSRRNLTARAWDQFTDRGAWYLTELGSQLSSSIHYERRHLDATVSWHTRSWHERISISTLEQPVGTTPHALSFSLFPHLFLACVGKCSDSNHLYAVMAQVIGLTAEFKRTSSAWFKKRWWESKDCGVSDFALRSLVRRWRSENERRDQSTVTKNENCSQAMVATGENTLRILRTPNKECVKSFNNGDIRLLYDFSRRSCVARTNIRIHVWGFNCQT